VIDSKKTLIFLVSLFAYINFYVPLNESNVKDIARLSLYEQKLKAENSFIENKNEIGTYIENSKSILADNKKIMHDVSMQSSIIFNKQQSKIKNLSLDFNAKLVNVLWGEPHSVDNSLHVNMPFTFIVQIEPKKLSEFLIKLLKESKAMTIKQVFFVKKKKDILVNIQVHLLKYKYEQS